MALLCPIRLRHVIPNCMVHSCAGYIDHSIFDADAYYSLEAIESRLKAASYLNRGVTFHLDAWDDAENEQVQRVFYSRDGLCRLCA